ncbi:cysteine proteinase [Gyrodon lividus]|nr:cysteine proteinase [Gyrodon lividus]
MVKQKTPTPQDLYKARKAREEKEKNALLPPGLVNHGNTCFMNSVLQGFIATQSLEHLVQFKPISPAIQLSSHISVASRRSPELTNGHGLGGEYDQPWAAGLPIGDQFISVVQRAWDIRNSRKRESMSPKEILSALGKKYDQYMDFRQQDAHEFLCHLLDAMRMEEIDIIKKRSLALIKGVGRSPQPPAKMSVVAPSSGQDSQPVARPQAANASHPTQVPSRTDDELFSFVDMLFGGKLTSILVCQACKHVSHTYEDFNDLSLSIKPEDYVRERKRDKLKQLAKKLRHISGTALSVGIPIQRSSSVPVTPVRDTTLDSPEVADPTRRRSIDLADVEVSIQPGVDETQGITGAGTIEDPHIVQTQSPPMPESPPMLETSPPSPPTDFVQSASAIDSSASVKPHELSGYHVGFVEPEKINGKEKKDKDESWAKLSRRISVTVGLTKNSREHRRQFKEERKGTSTPAVAASVSKVVEDAAPVLRIPIAPVTMDTVNAITSPDVTLEREPTSLSAVNDKLQAQLANVRRSFTATQRLVTSPSVSSTPRFPLISRPSSPANHTKRLKHPRLPKPKLSTEEEAYLRDILADTNPPGFSKPFSLFKQPKEQSTSSSSTSQNIFLKFNQLGGVEECLRLFTSVEVLDGDNMVRCHRCWKIANGFYKPREKELAQQSDSCTDSDDDGADSTKPKRVSSILDVVSANGSRVTPAIHSPTSIPFPPSHSATSLQDTLTSHDTHSTLTRANKPIPPSLQLNDSSPVEFTSPINQIPTYGGFPIPLISTTAPESPMSAKTAKPTPIRADTISSTATHTSIETASSSRTSLSAPPDRHRRYRYRSGDSNTESDGLSEEDSETVLSTYSDVSSGASPTLSPNASQEHLDPPSQSTHRTPLKEKPHSSGVPRSKQVLMRPAYKRYLIATPPPILVVHLKRFQQTSKSPVVSFSTGFKKLDDYISFPEYLDLAPYLAPRREDYFDSKVAVGRGRARRAEPCMYRLYAVVVHIGNMLGGHYVAYTALPPSASDVAEHSHSDNEKQRDTRRAPRDWAHISDMVVRLSSLDEVLKSKAYICMYERI